MSEATDYPGRIRNPDSVNTNSAAAKKPVSAMLARLLAEAAAGYPDRVVYFTALYKPKGGEFDLQHYFDVEPAPPSAEHGVFGPYETTEEPNKHDKDMLEFRLYWRPKGSTGGPTGDKLYKKEACDMVVLSLAALDKFVIPYYARIGGPERALQIRNEFLAADAAVLRHLPGSEPESGTLKFLDQSYEVGI